jgi:hypothetical protein
VRGDFAPPSNLNAAERINIRSGDPGRSPRAARAREAKQKEDRK